MKNVDDLIDSASELADQGFSKGEIADELNVSRETASWLVERAGSDTGSSSSSTAGDIHVDWSTLGRDSTRLRHLGAAMADKLQGEAAEVDLTIGIEKAGVPIATAVAQELETDLGAYAPRKHQWNEGELEDRSGTFSRNFAEIRGRECYVVDDTITTGTTMTETIQTIRDEGGEPVACIVLADKQGYDEIDGVPVYSLLQVISVAGE